MALAQLKTYTEEDYYGLSEEVRAELINGQIYCMSVPSRIHQEILNAVNNTIYNYIRSKKGQCKIYPAPFAVRPFKDDDKTIVELDISVICDPNKLTERGCTGTPDWIIDPRSKYHLEKTDFEVKTYTLQDRVKADIFDDLWIDFKELEF